MPYKKETDTRLPAHGGPKIQDNSHQEHKQLDSVGFLENLHRFQSYKQLAVTSSLLRHIVFQMGMPQNRGTFKKP